MNRPKGKERWIHCYKSSQKILLVGEGDFSFSACLARAFRTAENIVATSYLDKNSLHYYHWTSIPHLEELESLGCLLLYKVDVYKMHTHPKLKNVKFDIVVFNFPHAGHYDYLCERDQELIEMHKKLVEAYFKSASKMLSEGGEVHLRHREDPPYDSWNVVLLAGKAGLTLKEKVVFNKSDYSGYHNKRGGGINTNKSFPIVCAYTYKFAPYVPEIVERHCYDRSNKVHDEKVQVVCGNGIVYDHVNVSKITDEDNVNKLQKDGPDEANEYDDLFVHINNTIQKFDKMHLKNDDDDHDIPEKGERYVLEMKQDLHPQHSETDEVHDDDPKLPKKDDEVHVDSQLEPGGSARLKTEHVARSGNICNFCLPAEWLLTWFES
ncbi:hypothetical protein Hanom_Chr03g00240481 [Helianthus anomalus]